MYIYIPPIQAYSTPWEGDAAVQSVVTISAALRSGRHGHCHEHRMPSLNASAELFRAGPQVLPSQADSVGYNHDHMMTIQNQTPIFLSQKRDIHMHTRRLDYVYCHKLGNS